MFSNDVLLLGLVLAVLFGAIHLVFRLADAARSEEDE